jgi:hypothetical protein
MSKLSMLRYIIASIFVTIVVAIIPCLAADQGTSAENLTHITDQHPPYSYEKDGSSLFSVGKRLHHRGTEAQRRI